MLDPSISQVTIGDARKLPLPDESIDLVVTSPPYWNLRDYGGIDHQIGLEESLTGYLDSLAEALDEMWRVLATWGNVFINIGDTYLGSGGPGGDYADGGSKAADRRTYDELSRPGRRASRAARDYRPGRDNAKAGGEQPARTAGGSAKSRALIPQRLALLAFDQGWLVRQEIIWRKPVGELGQCLDRVLTQHEQIWHLVKQPKHYPFKEGLPELRTPLKPKTFTVSTAPIKPGPNDSPGAKVNEWHQRSGGRKHDVRGAAPRSVWDIAPTPTKYEHYAAYPEELARRCIQGWAPIKVCATCGEPAVRVVEPTTEHAERQDGDWSKRERGRSNDLTFTNSSRHVFSSEYRITGLTDCGHDDWRPARVLDPFAGTGTTIKAARDLGRIGIGIDCDPASVAIAEERAVLNQMTLEGH